MNRRGFTLLELMIVIIIIGVLATVGIMQYTATIEKSRGAEARQVLGSLRSACAALYMEKSDVTGCTQEGLRIGLPADVDKVPNACAGQARNYFAYTVPAAPTGTAIVFTATRCTTGGKAPQAKNAGTLTLSSDYSAGTDSWGGTGGY